MAFPELQFRAATSAYGELNRVIKDLGKPYINDPVLAGMFLDDVVSVVRSLMCGTISGCEAILEWNIREEPLPTVVPLPAVVGGRAIED